MAARDSLINLRFLVRESGFHVSGKKYGGVLMAQQSYFVRTLSAMFSILMSFIVLANYSEAEMAKEIDVSVNEAMRRSYKQVGGAKAFMAEAKAVLVMPNVTKGGFFVGGEYGQGALRVKGRTKGYYNLIAGSYGFTFGAERMDIIIAFMTADALKGFQKVEGWEVGA
jgi:lipid-binding SYLF domain-containing protein